ncbi:MAG: DUF4845 domain-containing protein [Burkholderiaceae bacterium]
MDELRQPRTHRALPLSATRPVPAISARRALQRGVTLFGLLFWAVIIGFVALVALRVLPTMNEYFTIQRAINKVAADGGNTVPAIRAAFDKQKDIEYSISSISGKDLSVTKDNDKVVISFAYDKEIELMSPVFLLIKYEGRSK